MSCTAGCCADRVATWPPDSGHLADGRQRPRPASARWPVHWWGAKRELAELGRVMEDVLDAGGRLVVITGEAGIGKTRLLLEVAADARTRGMCVMSAWCRETERPLPFRPWVDALRAERATLDPALAGRLSAVSRAALLRVYPELADGGGSPDTDSDEHGLLFEAMGELTGLVAERGPVLIVLEDLHWADTMSVRLLAFLSRRLGALPVLMVASTRPEDAVDTPVVAGALDELRREGRLLELAIGPLNREDSLALARVSPGGAAGDLVDRIGNDLWAISEGNPFVIVETMRALSETVLPGTVGHPLIAASVREAVARRLARLSEAARRAVDTAAVVGRSFPFRLLLDASGLGDTEAAEAVEGSCAAGCSMPRARSWSSATTASGRSPTTPCWRRDGCCCIGRWPAPWKRRACRDSTRSPTSSATISCGPVSSSRPSSI